jgi:hypothetical protein
MTDGECADEGVCAVAGGEAKEDADIRHGLGSHSHQGWLMTTAWFSFLLFLFPVLLSVRLAYDNRVFFFLLSFSCFALCCAHPPSACPHSLLCLILLLSSLLFIFFIFP